MRSVTYGDHEKLGKIKVEREASTYLTSWDQTQLRYTKICYLEDTNSQTEF